MSVALHIIDLVTTDGGRKFAPAGRIAAAIIELIQQNGSCLPQDLNTKGFAPTEVAKHYHMAKSLAAVEMNLMSGMYSRTRRAGRL